MFLLFLLSALFTPVFAQDGGTSLPSFDLTTFAGLVAIVSFIVTAIAKRVVFIEKAVFKILTSVCTGVLFSFCAWLLCDYIGLSLFLSGLLWWQVVGIGILSGLSACGFYDLIKSIGILRLLGIIE